MPLSAIDMVNPAFERMKQHLFAPFRWGQWFRFALVGFLAGEMGQSGGCSVRLPFDFLSQFPRETEFQGSLGAGRGGLFIAMIVFAIVFAFIFGLIFLYLNSRMRFVLFDSIVETECRIRQSWRRRGGPALSYFIFQLLLSLAAFAILVVIVGLPALAALGLGFFDNPSQHIPALVLGGIIVGLLFIAWIITFILAHVLTKDFVVPQMAVDDVSPSEGWSRLWSMMKADKGGYAGYIGMKIVLSLTAAIVIGLVTLFAVVILLIPIGLVAAAVVFGGRAAGLTWNPVTIATAIVVGSVVLLALFAIACLVSVPAIVFFPAYSMHFLAERYPRLHALLFPPAIEPGLSSPSPQP